MDGETSHHTDEKKEMECTGISFFFFPPQKAFDSVHKNNEFKVKFEQFFLGVHV